MIRVSNPITSQEGGWYAYCTTNPARRYARSARCAPAAPVSDRLLSRIPSWPGSASMLYRACSPAAPTTRSSTSLSSTTPPRSSPPVRPIYHAPGTKGATPTYTIEQLVRAEIVRAWAASCSDPELEWLLATNLLVRWFVGLPLLGPTPDHSTLSRFHAWLSRPSARRALPRCA